MKVILTSVDQTRGRIFFLNSTDTVGRAKSLWADAESRDVNSFVLVSEGQVVSDGVVLEELPQLSPGIMELLVDEEVLLPVRAFRLKDEPKALASFCSMRAAELYGAARELLGIADGLETRFRVGDRVLSGERSLLESGVEAASGVEVEVGWRATVSRVGGGGEEAVLFFSEVLSLVGSPSRRVLCGDRLLVSAADVEALLLNAFEASNADRLVLEESSPVSVLEDGAVESLSVWPQEGLMCEAVASEVMFDDRLMAGGEAQSLVVPPPWVLLRAPLRLVVRLTNGKRTVLRVPRGGAVSDVVKAARPLEGARRKLQVVLGCRELDAHASLRSLALQDGSQVRLRCPPTAIHVRLGELQLRWEVPRAQECVSFGEIVAGVSPGDRTRRRILLSGLLVCEGCGRRLSKERQAFQSVPAACCELKSMQLRFADRKASKDPTEQIIPLLEPGQSSCTAASQTEGPDFADVAVQTVQKFASESSPQSSKAASKSNVRDSVNVLHLDGDVTMHLPNGFLFLCSVGRTPEYLSDVLRQKSCLFRIDDLVVRGRSLSSNKDWKKQTLKENGVTSKDTVIVKTLLSRNVDIRVVGNTNDNFTVTVNVGENCWEQIRPKLPIPDETTFNVFYQRGSYYLINDEQRSCVGSRLDDGESEEPRYGYLDEEDGHKLFMRNRETEVREFLTPTQGLRAAPIGNPVLFVSSSDVLGFREVPNGSLLTTLSPSALFDSRYIAMLAGLRFYSRKKDNYIVLYTKSGKLAFTHGGEIFDKINEIRNLSYVRTKKCQRLWLLLQANDLIPHWKFPCGLVISLYRREGVDVRIENERLVRKSSETCAEGSRWVMPREADELDEKFSKLVRNPKRKNENVCFCR